MVAPRSLNQCLEIIQHTTVGKLFSEIEQEVFILEREAEEAKKKAWDLEFRIFELHRMLEDAIESVVESYLQKQLPLKTRPGVWSVIDNKQKA